MELSQFNCIVINSANLLVCSSYPPYHPTVDYVLGNTRRVEWATAGGIGAGVNIVQNVTNPIIACLCVSLGVLQSAKIQ